MLDFNRSPIVRLPGVIFPGEEGYRMCSKTIMDTTTGTIRFDESGISNFVHSFNHAAENTIWRPESDKQKDFEQVVEDLKRKGKNKDYDCILGLSGGVDSSYLAHLCKEYGLRPLCVHFDYGWNSKEAVKNIHQIIKITGFDLYTYVIDWETFRELQKAYFEAGVLDLDVPADHLIFGALYRVAAERKIYTILSGNNIANEFVLPLDWRYDKADYVNLNAVNKKFGKKKSLKNVPTLSLLRRYFYEKQFNLMKVNLLDMTTYSKSMAMTVLQEKYSWTYYGGKHFETIFTRWYQGCYLPLIYGIDKRKAHLSNLILNQEISREEALEELTNNPPYERELQIEDCEYVAKKWGYTIDEFYSIFYGKKLEHTDFPEESDLFHRLVLKLSKIPVKLYSVFAKN